MNQALTLLTLRGTILKNSLLRLGRRSRFELVTLILFFFAAAGGLFVFFDQSFRFFKSQEPFGPILLDETFYLLNFSLFLMLFISTAISSYASLFRSKEVSFLLTKPVTWTEIYFLKLSEALWFSAWAFLFVVIPFSIAYGITKQPGFRLFPLVCMIFYLPLAKLAGMLGTLVGTFLVWLLPSRTRRRAALTIGIALAIWLLFRIEPEVVKEQGSIAGIMSGYLPHVAFAKNPLFPSYWATKGILGLQTFSLRSFSLTQDSVFYFLVLLSNTLFLIVPTYFVAGKLYPSAFFKAQDHGESRSRISLRPAKPIRWYDYLPFPSRPAAAFLEKDLKTFARDPAEWSQLILFFGLLLLYFINLRNLQFHTLPDFWKNLVFVLNAVGTYIVLSSFSMRFVFPMLSLEGNKSWLLALAPVRPSTLLLEKFSLGLFFSALLTMPLVFLSGRMLDISLLRTLFVTGLGFFVCVALTGLSVGFGALFPNFKSNNPAEIISSFGGSLLLLCHLLYLAVIGLFLALTKESYGMVFSLMAAASLILGFLPIRIGTLSLARREY